MKLFATFFLTIVALQTLQAQSVSMQASGIHDSNIFDTDSTISDEIGQLQLGVFNGIDLDQLSLNLSYIGSFQYFTKYPARSAHAHSVSLTSSYQFYREDVEQEEATTEAEQDSTEVEQDSTSETNDSLTVKSEAESSENSVVHNDSLDQFFYSSLSFSRQLNREDYTQVDNFEFEGSAAFRQPIHEHWNVLPSYGISFHNYPNLSGYTNLENLFGVQFTTDIVSKAHVAIAANLGIKSYPNALVDTVYVTMKKKTRAVPVTSNIPLVKQINISVEWNQKFSSTSRAEFTLTHFGSPNQEARVLPRTKKGMAFLAKQFISGVSKQSQLYDDHYGYSGNSIVAQLTHKLPFNIELTVKAGIQKKNYTALAVEYDPTASDTTLKREDVRIENEISISKTISLGKEQSLVPQLEFAALRNISSAQTLDFGKYTISLGLEYEF